jgi:hypothetical protein
MENNYFYCYSVKLKDFIKSMGLDYIKKDVNHRSGKPYFLFEKSKELDIAINKWNLIKIKK